MKLMPPPGEKLFEHGRPEGPVVYYCTDCSMPCQVAGRCSSCGAVLRLATATELANLGAELFIGDLSHGVDTRRFENVSSLTSLGYPRESRSFFKALLAEHPELFSPENVEQITIHRRVPVVDELWIRHHPEQEFYLGDRLVHHHWDQGPWAYAIPRQFHLQFNRDLHPLRYPDED